MAILLSLSVFMLLPIFADRTYLPRYLHGQTVSTEETVHVFEGLINPGQFLKCGFYCLMMEHDHASYPHGDDRIPAWLLVEE